MDDAPHARDVTGNTEKEPALRVFVAGASGAIGTRLVPMLIDRGHQVIGTFRSSPEKGEHLRALAAEAIALDLLDAAAVRKAVLDTRPEAIVHQATALADGGYSRKLDKTFAQTNRLRTEGTDTLLTAAREAGVHRFVAQSFAPYRYAREGGMVKTEEDPLEPATPGGTEKTFAAMAYLDQAVTDYGGIALRYGGFYGNANDQLLKPVRKRMFPIIGNGAGVMSFVHLDDAATATVLALEHDGPSIYNIVDDDPAALGEWLPVLANVLGAKPPRHVPAWVVRLIAGEDGVRMGTQTRGASNAKAKRKLGWILRYPSWRQGFVAAYSSTTQPAVGPTGGRDPGGAAQSPRVAKQ
jgi:nucleoside-diphosphate-sugar epimerase